jgi:hypothetical protein
LRLLTPTVDFLFSVPTKFFSLWRGAKNQSSLTVHHGRVQGLGDNFHFFMDLCVILFLFKVVVNFNFVPPGLFATKKSCCILNQATIEADDLWWYKSIRAPIDVTTNVALLWSNRWGVNFSYLYSIHLPEEFGEVHVYHTEKAQRSGQKVPLRP